MDTFKLDWNGIHGVSHWSRVRINGLKIAKQNGANQRVVELFAFLHDSKRQNNHYDPEHGKRASQFIQTLSNDLLKITDSEKELLTFACEHHTNSKGIITDDITIQTCWDSDRLDLGRVGIYPSYQRLNTDIGKDAEFIKQAYNRSIYSNRITIQELLKNYGENKLIMSKAFWILPSGEIIDIEMMTHIKFIIKYPEKFNITKNEIILLYAKYNEQIPVEGVARKIIIMDLLSKGYIRIRQYRNHWSISLSKLDTQSKLSLSKWAKIAMTIPNSGKYADVVISTIDGEKFDYSVEDLNVSKQI